MRVKAHGSCAQEAFFLQRARARGRKRAFNFELFNFCYNRKLVIKLNVGTPFNNHIYLPCFTFHLGIALILGGRAHK